MAWEVTPVTGGPIPSNALGSQAAADAAEAPAGPPETPVRAQGGVQQYSVVECSAASASSSSNSSHNSNTNNSGSLFGDLAEASRESVRSATQAAKSFITLTRKSAEQPAPRTISAPVCSPTPPATPATPQQPGGNSNDNSSAGAGSSNGNSSAAAGSSSDSSNSAGSRSGGSVGWRVSVGVEWTGSHYAQAMVTERTLKSTAASQQALLASAQQWLQQPSERRTLGEVMPGAFATQHAGTWGWEIAQELACG
jgi:hypothetical protein